jgi:nucleotide-binding universal stress UspA family protein
MTKTGIIICAIRGGESSRRVQERAIALAQERDVRVVFVYIIAASLMEKVSTDMADAVIDELRLVGESLLNSAVERASALHLNAETAILQGPVAETLEHFIQESRATILVLGSPGTDADHPAFNSESLNTFIIRLKQTYGVEVITV